MIGEYLKVYEDITITAGIGIIEESKQLSKEMSAVVVKNEVYANFYQGMNRKNSNTKINFKDEEYNIINSETTSSLRNIKNIVNAVDETIKNKNFENLMNVLNFKVYKDDKEIGDFKRHFKCHEDDINSKIKRTIYYSTLNLNEKEYTIYETSPAMKVKGKIAYTSFENRNKCRVALCVYDGDKLIAEIEKNKKVFHGKNRYTIYANDEKEFNIACLITSIYDEIHESWNNSNGDSLNSEVDGECYGALPYSNDKYSEDFIKDIVSKTNPEDLPKNMLLVKKLVKKSKYGKDVIIKNVIILVLMYCFSVGGYALISHLNGETKDIVTIIKEISYIFGIFVGGFFAIVIVLKLIVKLISLIFRKKD